MKKTILMLLAAISTGAMAEWVAVDESDGLVAYIDPSTIRKDGNFRRAWEVQDLKQRGKGGEMSRRLLNEYDCKEERQRYLSLSIHSDPMAGGNVIVSFNAPNKEWNYIAPGTIGASALKFVCGK